MLPDRWEYRKLGDVCRLLNGRAYKKDELLDDGTYPVLRVGNFFTSDRWYYSTLKLDPEKYCDDGDLLYAWSASFGPRIWRGGKVIYHYHIWKIEPDSRLIDKDFLFHFLEWDVEQVKGSQGNGSTMIHVTKGAMEERSISLPPLDEQQRIAEVLRSVDEAIAATTNTVQAAAVVRQVTLDAMIRRVLDDPETEVRPLSDVAEVRTGLAKNKNKAGPKVMLPYLRVANVQDGWFDLSDMQEIEVDPAQVDRYLLQAGDVLLTEGGDYDKLGRGGVWGGEVTPCLHQNHVFCVRPNLNALMSEYFALAAQSEWGRAYFLSCAKRTTNLASINSSQLKDFPVPVVAVTKQANMIAEIEGIDAMIDLEEQQLETLSRLRSEVSSSLLSGRVRVAA
jgi:type I restriction enzyme, S subunit